MFGNKYKLGNHSTSQLESGAFMWDHDVHVSAWAMCVRSTSRCYALLIVSLALSPAVALLVALVGIVGSAPVSHKPAIMDEDTIEQAHSLISKILENIPKVHTAWIKSQVSIYVSGL